MYIVQEIGLALSPSPAIAWVRSVPRQVVLNSGRQTLGACLDTDSSDICYAWHLNFCGGSRNVIARENIRGMAPVVEQLTRPTFDETPQGPNIPDPATFVRMGSPSLLYPSLWRRSVISRTARGCGGGGCRRIYQRWDSQCNFHVYSCNDDRAKLLLTNASCCLTISIGMYQALQMCV